MWAEGKKETVVQTTPQNRSWRNETNTPGTTGTPDGSIISFDSL